MQVSAVAITNRKDILTHVGVASDHHVAQKAIITNLSKDAFNLERLKKLILVKILAATIQVAHFKLPSLYL